jgi:hypothetical protein
MHGVRRTVLVGGCISNAWAMHGYRILCAHSISHLAQEQPSTQQCSATYGSNGASNRTVVCLARQTLTPFKAKPVGFIVHSEPFCQIL